MSEKNNAQVIGVPGSIVLATLMSQSARKPALTYRCEHGAWTNIMTWYLGFLAQRHVSVCQTSVSTNFFPLSQTEATSFKSRARKVLFKQLPKKERKDAAETKRERKKGLKTPWSPSRMPMCKKETVVPKSWFLSETRYFEDHFLTTDWLSRREKWVSAFLSGPRRNFVGNRVIRVYIRTSWAGVVSPRGAPFMWGASSASASR